MIDNRPELGLGIGWRAEIAGFVGELAHSRRLGFVEVVAESVDPAALPRLLEELAGLGLSIVPHGISLSLGGAARPEQARLDHLARLAHRFGSPIVSEHIAFVRAGDLEAGHLLPVPRTREALDVLVSNVSEAQARLPVPLALEHVAALVEWPDSELSESEFLREVLDRTGALLLLDVANLYANALNHGFEAHRWLDEIPLDRVAYVHVGGGVVRDGVYHDSHAHPVMPEVIDLVAALCAKTTPPGVLLERDDRFPASLELMRELDDIARAVTRGADARRGHALA